MREAARELNIGFFSRIERGRPLVRVKLAMSLDGRTALADGDVEVDHRRGGARRRAALARAQFGDSCRQRHRAGGRPAPDRAPARRRRRSPRRCAWCSIASCACPRRPCAGRQRADAAAARSPACRRRPHRRGGARRRAAGCAWPARSRCRAGAAGRTRRQRSACRGRRRTWRRACWRRGWPTSCCSMSRRSCSADEAGRCCSCRTLDRPGRALEPATLCDQRMLGSDWRLRLRPRRGGMSFRPLDRRCAGASSAAAR